MEEKYCPHCWPTRRRFHLRTHLTYLTGLLQQLFSKLKPNFLNSLNIEERGWTLLLNLFSFLGVVKFESEPNFSQLRNRSLIFWKEAQRRGIELKQIKIGGQPTNYFRLSYHGKNKDYEAIPLTINQNQINFDDKFRVKRLLAEQGVPVPRGSSFLSCSRAVEYTRQLDWPVVVKPRFGSLSEHATWNIKSEEQLRRAIEIAKQYQPGFIVEEHLQGSFYRATVLGREQVFVCKKERANVVGDGEKTIEQLIKLKNSSSERGSPQQKNTTLHEIPINERLTRNLKSQGLTLNSVPKPDQKVYLHRKIILSQGCDIIECTAEAHDQNKKLFQKIAKILKTDLVGIDYITPDITTPYSQQQGGVIEANSLPYVDMHQHPSQGEPQPVAKVGWDIVEEQLK